MSSTPEQLLALLQGSYPRQDQAPAGPPRRAECPITSADRFPHSDINWVIMDYLVSEGYPGAAAKFAQETNITQPFDTEGIRERVRIRSAIHAGKIDEAIDMINGIDPEVCQHPLHSPILEMIIVSCTTHIQPTCC